MGKGTRTPASIPQNLQTAGKGRRWAYGEGFLSGRQRARAADESLGPSKRPEPEMLMLLGDLVAVGA